MTNGTMPTPTEQKPKVPLAYRIFAPIGVAAVVLGFVFWFVLRSEKPTTPTTTQRPAPTVRAPIYEWVEAFRETFALDAGGSYFYGGHAEASTERTKRVKYEVSTKDAVDIYVVRTQSDWRLLQAGREGAVIYPKHTAQNVYTYEREMAIPESAGIVIVSKNLIRKNRVELTVWLWTRTG